MKNKNNILYYAPTKPNLFEKWEYYQTDLKMLQDSFDNVFICHNHFQFIKNIFKVKFIYSWWWHRSFLVVIISVLMRRKIICTGALHMFDQSKQNDFFSHHFLFRITNRISLKLADLNLFISKDQLESITSHVKVNNPQLLYSAIQTPDKETVKEPNFTPKPLVTLLFHSHLSMLQIQRKGLLALLPAFLQLLKEGQNIRLVIAGQTGDGLKFIKKFLIDNKIERNVSIEIDISKARKIKLMNTSDLLVNVSYMEGFGNACVEAMSLGLPVALSRFGASPELLNIKDLISMSVSPKGVKEVIIWYLSKTKAEKIELRLKVKTYAWENFNFELRKNNFKKLISKL